MSEKDLSTLIKRYEEAMESGKNIYLDADEFGDLAEYYDSMDDIDTARDIIETGISIHPGNSSLLLKKAKFAVYDGEYTQALEILDESLTEYDFDSYLLKIECCLQLDLHKEAHELTKELLEKEDNEEPDHIFAELGFINVDSDCFNEAVAYFQQSLKYNPENIDVLSDLAYAYEMLDDFDSAINSTNKILDIEPYTYEAWVNLGKLYSVTEKFEKAIDAFDFALTINDSDNNVLKLKAHCLSLSGRIKEAIEIFSELLKLNAEDASIYFLLEECYQSLEMFEEALENLQKYEDMAGDTIELRAKKAYLFLRKEDYNAALQIVREGLAEYPDSSDLNMIAGEIAFKQEQYQEAGFYFMSIYPQNRENFHLIDRLALISIKEENYEQAAHYTEKLLEIDPTNMAVKQRLALLYFEMDDKEQFNAVLDQFTDQELSALFQLIYKPLNPDHFDREMLVAYLNKARETRTLFKNLKY